MGASDFTFLELLRPNIAQTVLSATSQNSFKQTFLSHEKYGIQFQIPNKVSLYVCLEKRGKLKIYASIEPGTVCFYRAGHYMLL